MVYAYQWHELGMQYLDENGKVRVKHRVDCGDFVSHEDYKDLEERHAADVQGYTYEIDTLKGEIDNLTAELAECRADALRYRWLRATDETQEEVERRADIFSSRYGNELDHDIDFEIARSK